MLDFIDYLNQKNVTVQFDIENTFITPQSESSMKQFELEMSIVVPYMQKIVYIPNILDSLK
jgi:hypothetical protein